MARGDFSATALGRINARLNTLFQGERYNEQLNKPYDALRAMLERQTASFSAITVGSECRGVKATYLKDCDDTILDNVEDVITECAIVGKRVESVSVNFDINDQLMDGVTVYDDECDNNDVKAEEKTAFGLAKLFAKFRVALETRAIAFLDANGTDFNGVSVDYGTVGALDTTNIEFSGAAWTPAIVGQLQWLADQYGVYDAFLLDGGNLWLSEWENKYRTNGCCTVDSLAGKAIDLVYATKTLRQATGKKSTMIIDPNAYAFWSRNYYQSTAPVPMQDEYNTFVWKTPLPGVTFGSGGNQEQVYVDMMRQRQCEINAGQHRWKTVWMAKLHFVFNQGPDICGTGETGVIHTVNVD